MQEKQVIEMKSLVNREAIDKVEAKIEILKTEETQIEMNIKKWKYYDIIKGLIESLCSS